MSEPILIHPTVPLFKLLSINRDYLQLRLKTTSKCIADIIKNIDSTCIRRRIVDLLTVGTKEDTTDKKKCEGCDEQQCQCPSCKCCAVCINNVLVMKGASIVLKNFKKYREIKNDINYNLTLLVNEDWLAHHCFV